MFGPGDLYSVVLVNEVRDRGQIPATEKRVAEHDPKTVEGHRRIVFGTFVTRHLGYRQISFKKFCFYLRGFHSKLPDIVFN